MGCMWVACVWGGGVLMGVLVLASFLVIVVQSFAVFWFSRIIIT